MVLAPVLLLGSTLAALPDDAFAESVPQGVLQLFSFGMFFLVFAGLARMLAPAMPRTAILLLVTGTLGAQAGTAFGVVVIARAKGLELQAGDALEIAFDGPGLLFPLTAIGFGICLALTKTVPTWSAVALAAAGFAFPVSRIGTIAEVALVADLLFVVALAGVAASLVRSEVRAPAPALA